MICSNCNSPMPENSQFCNNCGFATMKNSSDAPEQTGGKGSAIVSLVLGIAAMTVPIPVVDIIMGVAGIFLAMIAKNQGYRGGLQTAGFVCSIIGTVIAVIYTVGVLGL